ncbi:MAG: hypothetical protein K2K82_07710 [Muribaculaceae bacterium]|nr:hypothetical protein [Muribaculaceae bacterium]
MEQKQTTPPYEPAWVKDMHKWQEENKEQRAVLCIATDNCISINTLFGKSLTLIGALLAVMFENPEWVNVCKGALTAKENPIAAISLISALEKSKQGETPTKENEDKTSDPSTKDLLKTILSKLADKL